MLKEMKSPVEPKYRQIARELLAEIRANLSIGAKLDPETQMARRFGVNVLTIREALRVLQEGGVIQRQRAIGTTVVNPLGGSWVSILCEMDVFSPRSGSLFLRSVIHHLRRFLRQAGLPSRVSIGETEPAIPCGEITAVDFLADLEANRLAGVLALSTPPSDWWLQKLIRQGIPVIGSNDLYPVRVSLAPWEDLNGALRCLLDYQRDRVAYIGWVDPQGRLGLTDYRAKALDELERCYPATLRKEWIKSEIHPERAGAGWDEFREIWSSGEERPNGLIVDDEHLLPDVEKALDELRISVPRDLLIVSHRTRGNTYQPRHPVIFQETDPSLYAYRMADAFLRLYRGEKLPGPTIPVPRLIIDDAVRNHPDVSHRAWTSGDFSSLSR